MSFGRLPFDEQHCGAWFSSYSQTERSIVLHGALKGLNVAEVGGVRP